MTIQLPGFVDSIQPGLQGIGAGLQQLVNPDFQRQAALREAIISGRIKPDELNNMGSAEVEQVFGKGTGGFAAGAPTAGHVADTAKAGEIQRILTSGTQAEKDELLASMTGTKTPVERSIQANEVITSGNQAKITTTKAEQTARESARQAQGEAVGRQIHARLGTDPQGIDLYTASKKGLITGDELNSLLAVPEYEQKYNRDREDYWQKQRINIEQQRVDAMADKKFNIQDYMQKITAARAGQIAEKFGADPVSTFKLIQDPTLRDKYLNADPKTLASAELPLYEAAKALKNQIDEEHGKDFEKQYQAFRLASQNDKGIINNPKSNDMQKAAAIQDMNALAKTFFKDKAPTYYYDKNTSAAESGHWYQPNQAVFYRKGGDPAVFGSDEPYMPSENDPSAKAAQKLTGTPAADPRIEKMAQLVAGGQVQLGTAVSYAPDAKTRNELTRRVKELQNRATTGSASEGITTGADSAVASSLKLPTNSINLNVGKDVTDSLSKTPMSKVIEYFTQGMQGAEKDRAVSELLAMSDAQRNVIIKQLKDEGKL